VDITRRRVDRRSPTTAPSQVLLKNTPTLYDDHGQDLGRGYDRQTFDVALGQVSGVPVNPAVTVGLAVVGKFPWRYASAYIVAQVIGAVVTALAA